MIRGTPMAVAVLLSIAVTACWLKVPNLTSTGGGYPRGMAAAATKGRGPEAKPAVEPGAPGAGSEGVSTAGSSSEARDTAPLAPGP